MENMKDKCSDCGKEFIVYDLIQVRDQYPNQPKYKMVCEDCCDKGDYEIVGRITP